VIADSLLTVGEMGYEHAERYHTMFQVWEDVFWSDIDLQPYARKGFGMVAYHISSALQAEAEGVPTRQAREDLEEMYAMLGNDTVIDWDESFREELSLTIRRCC
jgi:hypothetical protein